MESVFEQRSIPEPNTGCWLWTGCIATGKAGYRKPILKRNNKFLSAARESWRHENGSPELRKDQFVLHRYNVSECVNPDHLYLGTGKDNARDGLKNGKWGKLIGADKIAEIYRMADEGMSGLSIARSIGVHYNTVYRHIRSR